MTRSACSYCGVGCGITVETRPDAASGAPVIAKVTGDILHPSNFGRLCTKGATHADVMADTAGRLTTALRRPSRGGDLLACDVDDAVAEAAHRLRAIVDEHGPDAVAVYVSGQMSLEAQYVATKLAKGFLRTVHLESNSRLCMASAGTGYKQSLGADGPPGSYADFDCTDLFFVIGSNMADCHPILYLRMADRLKAGAKLIVVDPRRTATAERADLHLQIRPGTDLALLNGLLHLLVADGAVDEEFIAAHTEGWDAMPAFLADYPPSRVADLTGLAEADIRTAATMIAEAGDWMSCWTMGLNQSTRGTAHTNALCNLHLATGAICRPGSGPMSLTGQPNAMGGREMGYMGPGLPGQRTVTSAEDRAFVEHRWGLPPGAIRSEVGPGTVEMFRGLREGQIKAIWIICTNPVASLPNRDVVVVGLQRAELVITQDVYADTATNRFADIVLPATLWSEADAVTVNSERTVTLSPQCTTAPGQARPDWQLICAMADHLGYGDSFAYASAAEIFDEIRGFHNPRTGYDLRGVTYARLREGPVQWPCPDAGAPARNPIRYLNDGVSQELFVDADGTVPRLAFPTPSRRAVFLARPYVPAAESADDDFPTVLNTGRLPHQWHTMTKTGRVARLNRLNPAPMLEIHPDDAAASGIHDGVHIEVRSRRGRAVLPAKLTDRVRRGTTWAPFHWNDIHGPDVTVNAVTNDAVDPDSLQPELKLCAVRLTPLSTDLPAAAEPAPDEALAQHGPLVLWASQTGNAEELAGALAARLPDARLCAMDDVDPARLSGPVILVTSTFGDGGPPDNGAAFWERLSRAQAPSLSDVHYTVLGLGDRSYAEFCGHARALDLRMAELGAVRIADRADCELTDDEPITRWTQTVLSTMGATLDAAADTPAPFTRLHPLDAPLCRNTALTPAASAQQVHHIGFDISDAEATYAAGDSLGIYVHNCADVVGKWLAATGFTGGESVTVDGQDMPLHAALTSHYDVCKVTPDLLAFVAQHCVGPDLAKRLRKDRDGLTAWLVDRNGLDLVEEFAVRAAPEAWQQVLVRLTPRQYSISSSPLVSPDEVQLTVGVVRYGREGVSRRGGVASTFLAGAPLGTRAPVFLARSPNFRPPQHRDTPMIMVGPGTGVAPFRAFLQERRALGHPGANWLFFGGRHREQNFYYRDELLGMVDDGHLTRLDLAFSRDQRKRVYVQHRMIEHGRDVWRWLADGAHVYVCGDATRMARDVDDALTEIIRTHGGMTNDKARDYKRQLVADKRYVRDVY
ncbi:molybdopterin-dependent oxidoreductase [Mycobacterium sp. pV006]|uniref:molybdopterin-dependent oxidoreductase n=1 Tax=Mycobacterium sp. pV006 TaxID=3238983 RepID=UPI00351B34C6